MLFVKNAVTLSIWGNAYILIVVRLDMGIKNSLNVQYINDYGVLLSPFEMKVGRG